MNPSERSESVTQTQMLLYPKATCVWCWERQELVFLWSFLKITGAWLCFLFAYSSQPWKLTTLMAAGGLVVGGCWDAFVEINKGLWYLEYFLIIPSTAYFPINLFPGKSASSRHTVTFGMTLISHFGQGPIQEQLSFSWANYKNTHWKQSESLVAATLFEHLRVSFAAKPQHDQFGLQNLITMLQLWITLITK